MNQNRGNYYHGKVSGHTAILGNVCVEEISAYQSWPAPRSSASQVRKPQLLAANKISVSRASLESHRYIVLEHYSAEEGCRGNINQSLTPGNCSLDGLKLTQKG